MLNGVLTIFRDTWYTFKRKRDVPRLENFKKDQKYGIKKLEDTKLLKVFTLWNIIPQCSLKINYSLLSTILFSAYSTSPFEAYKYRWKMFYYWQHSSDYASPRNHRESDIDVLQYNLFTAQNSSKWLYRWSPIQSLSAATDKTTAPDASGRRHVSIVCQ